MSELRDPRLRALILVGGQSSRMNFPKYLLPMPANSSSVSSRPLLLHCLDVLEHTVSKYPEKFIQSVTISVRDLSQRTEVQILLRNGYTSSGLGYEFVIDTMALAGPAQGLLAAHHFDKTAHWLITGCDYPLLTSDALDQLIATHHASKKSITCFQNDQGFAEPLLSIWSCSALSILANLAKDVSSSIGPNQAIKTLQRARSEDDQQDHREYIHDVAFIRPLSSDWIRSVDTKDQWEAVKSIVQLPV